MKSLVKHNMLKKKVKCILVQALGLYGGRTAHTGRRGIAPLFLDHDTRRGEGSASRPGLSLRPGKTRYPLYRRLSGHKGRSGQVRKISPPGRPAHSQSLYRLRYPATHTNTDGVTNLLVTHALGWLIRPEEHAAAGRVVSSELYTYTYNSCDFFP